MAFPPEFLDELRARVRLGDVIGRRVALKRQGRELAGLCPFHKEKTPSFTVSEEKGFFHCFGCGAHGDVISFVMRSDGLSFPEAVERLAREAGLEVPRPTPEARARYDRRQRLQAALEAAAEWYERQLRAAAGKAARDYLAGRGLDDVTIARFRLGYAPRGNGLKAALLRRGFEEALLFDAGLLGRPDDGRESYDYFRDRIVFPITDMRGRVIAFGGRVMGDGTPKYLNSRESELFRKGATLYGLAPALKAARESGEVLVTEGYMDVIALNRAGIQTAVAPLGTALTEAQIELLWRIADEPVLCFDGDDAGRRAAGRAAERALPLLRPGKSLRFVALPAGEDPDSLVRQRGAGGFRELTARARGLVDWIWESELAARPVDTPERRAHFEQRLELRTRQIADRRVQEHYRRAFRARLWELFGPGRGRGADRRGSRGPRDRAPDLGAGLRASGDVDILELRRYQGLLAAAVNHPALVGEFGEDLGTLAFPAGELDKLRGEILKLFVPGIETAALKRQLQEQGFGKTLDRVLSQEVYLHIPGARPGAPEEDAFRQWKHLYGLLVRRDREADLDEAERELAEEGTEASLARIDDLRRQVEAVESDPTDLDTDVVAGGSAGTG